MRITKVYTRAGDDGSTSLAGGQRVAKSSPRVAAFGAVDELNAAVGAVLAGELDSAVREELLRVQNDLFHLGADLCMLEEDKTRFPDTPRIEERQVRRLEVTLDRIQDALEPLREFILPGGTPSAAALHIARTVCRRAELRAVELAEREPVGPGVLPYLNRLSDLLFVLARHENHRARRPDVYWNPGA